MSYTVLVTAPRLSPAGVARLEQANCRVLYLRDTQDAAEVARIMAAEPIDAVISRTVDLTGCAVDSCPTLRVVSKHGVGVSNIDVEACTRRKIPVYVTPGANAQSVAELTLALMLAAARRVSWMDQEIKAGRWSRAEDGLQLEGRRIGLVGFGQVGQRVAKACLAIGMKAVVFDPALKGDPPVAGVRRAETLIELLPLSDVLSLHVPLTARTRGMIGAAQLALLPKNAVFINTSRGEVVEEPALVSALQSGWLYAAGLDTMATEPLPADSPLALLPNVVLTPHIGGSTPAALAKMARSAADNALGFLAGRPVDQASCVNPQVLS